MKKKQKMNKLYQLMRIKPLLTHAVSQKIKDFCSSSITLILCECTHFHTAHTSPVQIVSLKGRGKKFKAFTLAEIKPSRGFWQVRNERRRSVAFTLAEILITLAIIGVVSAMTIPTLITKHQKMIIEKRITQDYSIINQAIRLQTADGLDMSTETVPSEDTTYLKNWYDKYWAPYLKTAKVCIDSAGCWQNTGETKILSGRNDVVSRGAIGVGTYIITVRLQNGTSISINSILGSQSMFGITTKSVYIVMYVDANGDSAPNVIGKDIYLFVWTRENGLVPAGYNKSQEEIRTNCSKNATGTNAGYYCLARVKLDGWKVLDEVWNITH